jgi:hypothetical protein
VHIKPFITQITVYNSNNFDYSGIMIVHWQTSSKPDFNSLIVEDSDGSVYDWYIEQGQVIVNGVSIERHTNKGFYFYFDTVSTDLSQSMMEWIVLGIWLTSAAAFFISLAAYVTTKDEKRRENLKTIVLISLAIFGIISMAVVVFPYLM